MDYSSALEYLDSFKVGGIRPRLGHTRFILERLGFRQDFKVVHVAGSKGKGSVCAFVNSVLCEADFRTGLYTSPPLQDFVERISVNKVFIGEADVAKLVSEVEPVVNEMSESELGLPTHFEVVTALALRYFQLKGVEYAVLEVGLGGRLDATNVVDSVVSVVTNIEFEHTQFLGNTVEQITREKAGIIKPNTVCVTASEDNAVLNILKEICRERKTRLLLVGQDIKYKATNSNPLEQEFNVSGNLNYQNLKITLPGEHQIRNAVTAIAALNEAVKVPEGKLRSGLAKTRWPGRMETVSEKPLILLDGAHTIKGVEALKQALKEYKYEKLHLVLGVSKDKPMAEITRRLAPMAHEVIATKAAVENAGDPSIIFNEASKHTQSAVIGDVKKAVERAASNSGPGDLILITGSLYVVGEARKIWHDKVEL